MKRVYLDHSTTTQIDPLVLEEMLPYLKDVFGNPSSLHYLGKVAKKGIELARERIAQAISADSAEVYFTSGGTESNNLAIRGVAYALKDRGNHIITSKVEHLSVLGVCKALEEEGFRVTYIDVDTYGMVKPEEILAAIEPSTILISITYANNEVGTIQPIKEISQIAQDKGIYLHTDAVQAFGNLKFKVEDLGVDLLSLSSHKIYGPKGAGALYVKKGTRIVSILHGGGHEKRLRPGTENVPGIVGFGKAAEIAVNKVEENKNYLTKLRDQLYNGVVERIEDVSLNGHPTWRLPNILNISFGGVEGELLMLNLELKGIICSAGSAYTLNSSQPSHVLTAMGVPKDKAWEAIRFSLGRNNTEEEVNYTIDVLEEVISQLRSISEVYKRN